HEGGSMTTAATGARLPESVGVTVIGAGQAGLSVAWHLRRLGMTPGSDLLVLDRGPDTGGAWQFRWHALRLDLVHKVDDLPGMGELGLSFDTADPGRPARDIVREYYDRYERHFDLRVRRPVHVHRVRSGEDAFVLETDHGTVRTTVLVNATGTWARPFRPHVPGA